MSVYELCELYAVKKRRRIIYLVQIALSSAGDSATMPAVVLSAGGLAAILGFLYNVTSAFNCYSII